MPMIDIYAPAGTFKDRKKLAIDAAATLKAIEGVPDIPMFRQSRDPAALTMWVFSLPPSYARLIR